VKGQFGNRKKGNRFSHDKDKSIKKKGTCLGTHFETGQHTKEKRIFENETEQKIQKG